MAALSLHYITFRSKQIGLHLQPSSREKKSFVFGWVLSELLASEMNCVLMKWMHKRPATLFFLNKGRLGCPLLYSVSCLTQRTAQPDASGSTVLVLIHPSSSASCRVTACCTRSSSCEDFACGCYQLFTGFH